MDKLEKIFTRYEKGYTAAIYGTKDMANKYMRDDFDYLINTIKNSTTDTHEKIKKGMWEMGKKDIK